MQNTNKKSQKIIDYNNNYNKTHYNNISLRLKPDDFKLIADYCSDNGINSKTAYIIACVKYCIDNNIDVMD